MDENEESGEIFVFEGDEDLAVQFGVVACEDWGLMDPCGNIERGTSFVRVLRPEGLCSTFFFFEKAHRPRSNVTVAHHDPTRPVTWQRVTRDATTPPTKCLTRKFVLSVSP